MTQSIEQGLQRAVAAMLDATEDGVTAACEHILTESVNRTPVREGTLRRSAGYKVAQDGSGGVVYYDTPYAVKQHEDMSLSHRAGQAKYLEDTMSIEAENVLQLFLLPLQAALGGD